ncbi:glycogen synthase GlgA [Dechloromonas sp.]|uniref:glycogen synthase GlgA n=1 Tax=Dechloromonas sp. TaxID=1917218 RepID=UPI00120460F7|nr:glycogen synthase GlgA [Dechloromonas sp.]MBU3696894.1 glycogen synthase GlgA [Dechloromonas sp.]TEX48473.1 MAG: starch synthase [Rhodocyclaceae bacterium]
MKPLAILFATSEMAPWVKTGGLGDVAAALPAALRRAGHDIRVLMPYYPALAAVFPDATVVAEIPQLARHLPAARLRLAVVDELPLLLIDCPALYARPGNPYLDAHGHDWPDNVWRFGLLSRVAALLGQVGNPYGWQADVVHANDWQTALAPAWLHYEGGAASVVTVHNIAFQGCFGHDSLAGLGLPEHAWRFDGVEYHGTLSFLKAGLQLASQISTVSPTYAREIQDEHFGYGLAPLLRHRAGALRGILNGVDTDIWNPADDPALAAPYAANRLAAKRTNKAALQAAMGLRPDDDRPLFGVISRLTQQKGLDLLLTIADGLPHLPAQLVVLGSGDKAMEAGYRELAVRYPGEIAVRIGFDEELAHRIEAGADCFVMPSRFEPCGLNQMYSLRYGTPPIVRATGGLADTVVDVNDETLADKTANGFVLDSDTPHALWVAMMRVAEAWQDRRLWQRIQKNGMRRDFSWKHAAADYLTLYRDALARPA